MVTECPSISTNCFVDTSRSPSLASKTVLSSKKDNLSPHSSCKIDDFVDSSRVLKHIDKVLQRIPADDLTNYCQPISRKNTASASLSLKNVASHLVSLRTGYVTRLMRPIIQKLLLHPKNANVFNIPVDPVAFNIPTYPQIIKNPMDLGTVKCRLQCGYYSSIRQCVEDVRLVFCNAITFNGAGHYISRIAKELLDEFEEEMKVLEEKSSREVDRRSQHKCTLCSGSLCLLCGEKCLKFETPSLFCYASSCGQRIKKNAVYFISSDGTLIWCQKCYASLPTTLFEGVSGFTTIPKKSLLKRRFDEEIAEPWVECDKCGSWIHQICALFCNFGGRDSSQFFNCPMCLLETEKPAVVSPLNSSNGDFDGRPSLHGNNCEDISKVHDMWKASKLPRSRLSDFLEAAVTDLLVHLGHRDVASTISIRMTSNHDGKFEVPTCIRDNFQTNDGFVVQSHVAYRQKCIQLFQSIDGIDVCVFCLYVQEFDSSCPPPNQSCVYIAYLDSVDYFRPSSVRTIVYQEILVGYLKWAQARGFKQCHLWSCPPQRGDNFIFWCHPAHQRTPSRDRLNSWYNSIFHRCKALGVIKSTDKFWHQYFAKYCTERKREDVGKRQAAKNSFVNIFKGCKKAPANNKKSTKVSNDVDETQSISSDPSVGTDFNGSQSTSAPICPPIFDGDFWALEFSRLHRGMMQKDPFRGSAQACQSHYRWCRDTIKSLFGKPIAVAFRQPVDPVALNIPLYFTVIQNPMDLGTVREKLRSSQYPTLSAFVEDVRLVFRNAMRFNPEGHLINSYAKTLMSDFERNLTDYVNSWLLPLFPPDTSIDTVLQQTKLAVPPTKTEANVPQPCDLKVELSNPAVVGIADLGDFGEADRPVVSSNPPTCTKSVRIVADDTDTVTSSSESTIPLPRKRALSRVISEDSSLALEGCLMDKINVLREDPRSVTVVDNVSISASYGTQSNDFEDEPVWKRRRGSMDSISTIDPFDLVNGGENLLLGDNDYCGRLSLSQFSATSLLFGDSDDDSADTFCAHDYNKVLHRLRHDGKTALTPRALQSLMGDLSKAVQRMTDDLFILHFSDPDPVSTGAVGDADHANSVSHSTSVHKKKSNGKMSSSLAHRPSELSQRCVEMLAKLTADTSDPDTCLRSPLIDSRYTFLETCQYRHYQFDTLRRAKYSSLMMLYHLHHPHDPSCRPRCKICDKAITNMRWHCEQCADWDICHPCKQRVDGTVETNDRMEGTEESHSDCEEFTAKAGRANNLPHIHPLTPYRVSFR